MKAIVYCKFPFLPGYQLDNNCCTPLSSGRTCGGQWLKSICLFLCRRDGISVAVLGSSLFAWHMHCWADAQLYTTLFLFFCCEHRTSSPWQNFISWLRLVQWQFEGQRDFKSSVYRDWHTCMKLQWWAYLYARIIRVHIHRLLSTLYHAARFRWWRLLGGVGRKMQQHFEGGGNSRCGRFWGNIAFSWSLTCNLKVMGESSIEVFAIKKTK